MSQYIRSCLGGIAGIIVTDFLSVVHVEATSCIAIVLVLLIEQVIDGHADGSRLHPRNFERVGEVQVAYKIGIKHMVFLTGIAHVLFAHIMRLQRYIKLFIFITEQVVQYKIGRKGDWSITMVNFPLVSV